GTSSAGASSVDGFWLEPLFSVVISCAVFSSAGTSVVARASLCGMKSVSATAAASKFCLFILKFILSKGSPPSLMCIVYHYSINCMFNHYNLHNFYHFNLCCPLSLLY